MPRPRLSTLTKADLLATITEADFSQSVVTHARSRGWTVFRTWNSIHSPAGWPDLFMMRERNDGTVECLAVELKTEKGKVTDPQTECLRLLKLANIPAYVWRPSSKWEDYLI